MNTVSSTDVELATGLTYRTLDYIARQECFVVTTRGSGDHRRWSPVAVAQAALYAALRHSCEHRTVFAACRAIAHVIAHAENVDVIGGQWLVLRGTTVAIVHDPGDFVGTRDAMSVVPLDGVLAIVRVLFPQEDTP